MILILSLLKEVQSPKSFETSFGNEMLTMEEAIITNCKFQTPLHGTEDKRDSTFVFVNTLLNSIFRK